MFHLSKTSRYPKTLISIKTLLYFSTSSSPNPKPHHNLVIQNHLITEFGLSTDKAIYASSRLPPSITPSSLNSVPHFLKQIGFTNTHITNLISKRPKLLTANIHKTLQPKLNLLQHQLGFSPSSLAEILISNPNILIRGLDKFLVPAVNFLKSLLHSNENVLKVVKRNTWLLSADFRAEISSNINTLRQCGVSEERIFNFLVKQPRFFSQKPEWVQGVISRAEEFGVGKDSGLFVYAVYALSTMSRDTVKRKFEIYKSYGWTEYDILSAFRNSPGFLMYSEKKIRDVMSFIKDELRYDPLLVALHPRLLSYSLDKRLRPRYKVLKILKSKKLLKRKSNFMTILNMSEKKFLDDYVVQFVEKTPSLHKAYYGSQTL